MTGTLTVVAILIVSITAVLSWGYAIWKSERDARAADLRRRRGF